MGPRASLNTCRPHVDPVRVTTYDWVHTFLQNGIFNCEAEAMLSVASEHGCTRQALQEFLRDGAWRFSRAAAVKHKQLHRIFDERRRSKTEPDKIKRSCAEALGVYGLVRPSGACKPTKLKSSCAVCFKSQAGNIEL